jgi:hypothetical protein
MTLQPICHKADVDFSDFGVLSCSQMKFYCGKRPQDLCNVVYTLACVQFYSAYFLMIDK